MKGIIFLWLLIYLFDSENKHKGSQIYAEIYFVDYYFSIVHISSNNVLDGLKSGMHEGNIHVKETVSQIVFFKSKFFFNVKKGVTFYLFFMNILSRFTKKQTGAYLKTLKHNSLDSNVVKMYVRFQVCNLYNETDIDIQKNKN